MNKQNMEKDNFIIESNKAWNRRAKRNEEN